VHCVWEGEALGDREHGDDPLDRAGREKRAVAFSSLVAALLLTAMKLIAGLATNSVGILAEAAHSGLDLAAAALTCGAVRVSAKPADEHHAYGHGKFENLSALAQTLLLLATCVWVFYEATARLSGAKHAAVEATFWAFLVMAISIAVDWSRSRALKRAARKHRSQALEADALHFSTDIWSSAVVMVGLAGVALADRLGVAWLEKADAGAAIVVALFVVWVSLRLGKESIDELMDRVPAGLREKLHRAAEAVSGVEEVTQLRLRRSGPAVFADVTLAVDRSAGLENSHDVAHRAEQAIRRVVPDADVVVHVEPVPSATEEATTTIRVLARRHGLEAHGIRIYQQAGQRSVEVHLEVDQSLDVQEAHRQATEFEKAVGEVLPEVERILTHLEPRGDAAATWQAEPAEAIRVREAIVQFVRDQKIGLEPHELNVQSAGGRLAVSFHCALDPAINITEAHAVTARLEDYLRRCIPNLGRVLIHVEPSEGRNSS